MNSANGPIRPRAAVSYRNPDGTRTILNFRFGEGSRHVLLHAEDAPPALLGAGRELVRSRREMAYRVALLASANVDGDPMRIELARADHDEAEESFRCDAGHYRKALDRHDPWAVLAVDGHAIVRPDMLRDAVEVVRLDGKAPCEMCRGCGRQRIDDSPRACFGCDGSGVSPDPAILPACIGAAIEAREARLAEWTPPAAIPADAIDPAYGSFVDSLRTIDF